jgi:fatty-acyl-CoA synthase/long-chain acyl-CoA synthetase
MVSNNAPVPDKLTLEALFRRTCQKYSDDPLATFKGESIRYGRAWEEAGALSSALAGLGIEKGDAVGLMMSNQLGYVAADLACVRGGYAKVAMNDMLTEAEYKHIISDSGAKAVIVGQEFVDTIADLDPGLADLETIVVLGSQAPDGMEASVQLIETHAGETPDIEIEPGDSALFQYTGGTTGKPKGAKHPHYNIATNLLAHVMELDINPGERMLLMTPLPHSAGYTLAAGSIRGAHVTMTQGFDAGEFLELIETEEVTWSWLVPTMIYRVLDHEALEETDVSSIETLVYGAAPIARERLEEALEVFGQVFIQLYGQSEVPNIGTTLPKDDHAVGAGRKLDSCGQATVLVDTRIASIQDKQNTEPLPPGEEGEILLRAPYQMTGYHRLPEKTDETLVNGWIRTGDIGRMDEDGYVYILDRDSDMIVTGGMNVYTTNVEDELIKHPNVNEVAVIGIPHDEWGEAVHAVVVSESEVSPTESEIRAFADEHLADYKKPKSVEFVDELPTTPYGKVDKKALREPYWNPKERQVA